MRFFLMLWLSFSSSLDLNAADKFCNSTRRGNKHIFCYMPLGTSSVTRKHSSVKNTSTDKTRNKIADIRQGTDEILGRYPAQLLFNPSSTHVGLLDLLFQRPH